MRSYSGFKKKSLTNKYLLLANGEDKSLGDFIGSISYNSSTKKLQYTPIGGSATDIATFGDRAFDSTSYLPLSGGTLTGSLRISGDWENDFGIHLDEGGSSVYGADIVYGAGDTIKIGTRNNSSTTTVALTIARGSTTVDFKATPTVNGTAVSLNGHTHSYLPLSGGTMTGALHFANGTWNNVGDDIKMGDHNVAGALGLLGINGNTRIDFCQYGNASNYKSIVFDGTTLSVDGNCNYANSAGSAGNADTLDGYHAGV